MKSCDSNWDWTERCCLQNAYSSDSGRALQTAQLILDQNKAGKDLEVVRDPDLREFNFGSYEGI